MEKYFETLKKCNLFSGIDDYNLNSMLNCLGAKVESFDKKCTVFQEGTEAKYIGIILSGTAQIIQNDCYGNRSILASVRESEIFAEAFACADSHPLPFSVIASEPCSVMFISCSCIVHTCKNSCSFHQRLIYNLMRELASKNIMYHQKAEITSARTTRDKLMTYLSFYSKESRKNSFDIPFDRQELADYLEVDRSGLSAEISKLRKEGVLECRKNHFRII